MGWFRVLRVRSHEKGLGVTVSLGVTNTIKWHTWFKVGIESTDLELCAMIFITDRGTIIMMASLTSLFCVGGYGIWAWAWRIWVLICPSLRVNLNLCASWSRTCGLDVWLSCMTYVYILPNMQWVMSDNNSKQWVMYIIWNISRK